MGRDPVKNSVSAGNDDGEKLRLERVDILAHDVDQVIFHDHLTVSHLVGVESVRLLRRNDCLLLCCKLLLLRHDLEGQDGAPYAELFPVEQDISVVEACPREGLLHGALDWFHDAVDATAVVVELD